MRKTILGISWLGQEVRACAYRKGRLIGEWHGQSEREDLEDFGPLARQAVQETGYDGSKVSVVLGSRRLTHQLVDTPPTSGSTLESYLERKVKQLNPFQEKTVWSYRRTSPSLQGSAVLLHFLPRSIFDRIIDGAKQAGLHVVKILPPTLLLERQVNHLPLEQGESTVIASETGEMITLVCAQPGGKLLFGRSVHCSWREDPTRVVREFNRSVLYAKQQFDATVQRLWWFGSEDAVSELQSQMDLTIAESPVKRSPNYWIEEGLKVPNRDEANLVPVDLQLQPMQRVIGRVVTGALILFFLAATGTMVRVEYLVKNERQDAADVRGQLPKLQTRQEELSQSVDALEKRVKAIQSFLNSNPRPVPAWFFAYLGKVVPENLVLTQYRASKQANGWQVQILAESGAKGKPVPGATEKAFKSILENGPYHMNISAQEKKQSPLQQFTRQEEKEKENLRIKGRIALPKSEVEKDGGPAAEGQ